MPRRSCCADTHVEPCGSNRSSAGGAAFPRPAARSMTTGWLCHHKLLGNRLMESASLENCPSEKQQNHLNVYLFNNMLNTSV